MKKIERLFMSSTILFLGFLGTTEAWSQEWDHEYVPFVEEGKVWNCKSTGFEIYKKQPVDCIFSMRGDTLIGEKNYKKVLCEYEKYYGDKETHYYCAVREDAYHVFFIESDSTAERLLYDFSSPKETLIMSYADSIIARTNGYHLEYSPTNQYLFYLCLCVNGEVKPYYIYGSWIEGAGACDSNPFDFMLNVNASQKKLSIIVDSCLKDDICYFHNDWLIEPGTTINETIRTESNNEGIFDLQGRRIQGSPKHGVYIQNGKKVMKLGN
jgi:hypothetical protein